MAHTVRRIIEIEGPIHVDEIVARVRDLWKLGRAGARIQAAVNDALLHIAGGGEVRSEGNCYVLIDAPVPVRDRSAANSKSLKRPDYLPPQEIRAAVTQLLADAHGGTRDEVIVAASRALGFQATSQQLRDGIDGQIDLLIEKQVLSKTGNHLSVIDARTS
jgi:hypothetical protein